MNHYSSLFRYLVFFLLLIPLVTLANDSLILLNNHQYSVGWDLGIAKPTSIGKSTTFPLGYSTFSYGSNTNDLYAFISGISISKILPINSLYTLQPGLSAHFISSMEVEGNLAQGISPPFYQASYSYNINSYQYLADVKLSRQFYNRYFPYFYLGLGLASNRAYHYSTTIPAYLTVTPDYSSKTTNSLTYSLGVGVDYFVAPQLSLGLGYRFINLGKVGLGSGTIMNTNVSAKLMQSNLYIHTLLAQLNYFI